jgi:hypothetical protein
MWTAVVGSSYASYAPIGSYHQDGGHVVLQSSAIVRRQFSNKWLYPGEMGFRSYDGRILHHDVARLLSLHATRVFEHLRSHSKLQKVGISSPHQHGTHAIRPNCHTGV